MISTPRKTSDISIIVPTLNEAINLPALQVAASLVKELIVVDGGSSDGTAEIAAKLGFQVFSVTEPGGRGKQLNVGAQNATARILLFLHCDTQLPANFTEAILHQMEDPQTILAAFRLKISPSGPLLRLITSMANLRSRLFNLPYGDQGLCMRRNDFMRLGGFPETPIMEDFVLVRRAGKQGRVKIMPLCVKTSARRWQQLGTIRTTLINQLMILGYTLKISPERLAQFYRKLR